MQKILVTSVFLLIINSLVMANEIIVKEISGNSPPSYTIDGSEWIPVKEGQQFTEEAGISIPENSFLIMTLGRKKVKYTGPKNILVSEIRNDLEGGNNQNVFINVLVAIKDAVFAESTVTEGSTRGIGDSTMLMYGGLPEVESKDEIESITIFQLMGNDKFEELGSLEIYDTTIPFGSEKWTNLLAPILSANSQDTFKITFSFYHSLSKDIVFKMISDEEYIEIKKFSVMSDIEDSVFSSDEFISQNKITDFIGRTMMKVTE